MATEIACRTMDCGKKGNSSERKACLSVSLDSLFQFPFKFEEHQVRVLCPLWANFSAGYNWLQWLHATDSKRPMKVKRFELEEAHRMYQGLAVDRPNLSQGETLVWQTKKALRCNGNEEWVSRRIGLQFKCVYVIKQRWMGEHDSVNVWWSYDSQNPTMRQKIKNKRPKQTLEHLNQDKKES